MKHILSCVWVALLAALCMPTLVWAQQAVVVTVPFAQSNPALPHPAHEGARITLKAIVRNANCNAGYRVWWDTNFDQVYQDNEPGDPNPGFRNVVPEGRTVYDIGRTFLVPVVDRDRVLGVNVRVRNLCSQQDSFATFPIFVYDFTPSNDPLDWTADQLQVMSSMAIQEILWWMHRQTWRYDGDGGAENSQIRARYGQSYVVLDGVGAWTFTINGHLPAYPPNSMQWQGQPVPNGWEAANTARWNTDPYAETVIRYVHDLIRDGHTGAPGVPQADEVNTCGYDNPFGNQLNCNPIANTDNGLGVYIGADSGTYGMGMAMGGLTTVLPVLAGTPIQTGPWRGRSWEWLVQEVTDWMGRIQIDSNSGIGGWYYHEIDDGNCGYNDGSTTQWALVGLESAEQIGRRFGVIVNNRFKFRVAQSLVVMIGADNSAGYRCGYTNNFQVTGGAILGGRWLGVNTMVRGDGRVPFAAHNPYNADTLRERYDRYLAFTAANWDSTNLRAHGGGWETRLWRNGSYLCGNNPNDARGTYPLGVYNAGRCGNSYAMYSHQKGYRTGAPEMLTVGGHDWYREFVTYYVRAQDRNLGSYADFGKMVDEFCDAHSVTCAYGAPWLVGAAGALITTPALFNPKPVGIPAAAPQQVAEGCSGGNNGEVRFSHADSFHPNPGARIATYQWDVNAADGLWWNVAGAPEDFTTVDIAAVFSYRYRNRGNYTATLRVIDNGQAEARQMDVKTISIAVAAAPNVQPSAPHGGPYIVEVGQNLQLRGAPSDQNLLCGDTITTVWDLNDALNFGAANGASAVIPWANIANLPRGQGISLRMRVTDSLGLRDESRTTLTIYPALPVAVGRANPNPAACGQVVTFDGSGSYHPNPQRSIAQWRWNVDGQGDFDGGGANPVFTHTYPAFGRYNVTLQVQDDLGRTHETQFVVDVSAGNARPVAAVSQGNYTVLEGANLTLDGRPSSDANVACGDRIALYEWDINGDGDFGDAGIDAVGAQPVIQWAVLANLIRPADSVTGLPNNRITLRVTDSFGLNSTVNATVAIYRALPTAVIVQNPNPAPINLVTGNSAPTLDGRNSTSPIPGMTIVRFDWDFNDDGTFEVANQPAVAFVKVFNPVPDPDNIPAVFVRLRVTDRDGRTAEVRQRIVYDLPPTAPTADADPTDPPERGYHILVGDGVALDPRQSSDPDTVDFGDFLTTYKWDIANLNPNMPVWDRTVVDPNGARAAVVLNLTTNELQNLGAGAPGTYRVMLEVVDTTNLTGRDSANLYVYARNPVADATASPNPAACGAGITFDASNSNHPHPNVDVASYDWDFDADGAFDDGQGVRVVRAYNQFSFAGPIRVGLQVTDTNGNRSTTFVDVNITEGNRAPVAVTGGPYTIVRGDNLALDGRGSNDPNVACGDAVARWEWDLKADGSYEFSSNATGQQAITWVQLNTAGINAVNQYSVRLRVTDRFGVTAVNNVALNVIVGPTAVGTASPNRVACNDIVEFDARASRTDAPAGDPNFAIVLYEWDLDLNGTYETAGAVVRRNMAAIARQLTVRLRVTDASGHTSTADIVVNIDVVNVAPVAVAGGPYATGVVGAGFANVRLDGRGSFDPNAPCDAVSVWKWDTDGDNLYGTADNAVAGGPNGGTDDFTGDVIPGYNNAAWRVNQVFDVNLIVCDSNNPQACSVPSNARIFVNQEAPPVGNIVSPRATDPSICIAANPFDVQFTVSDPEGDVVTAIVLVGGVEVARRANIATLANGNPVNGSIQVNPAAIPEGQRTLEIRFDDGQGGIGLANAGGFILFDRTAPAVTIGAQLPANVCVNPNQVPRPTIAIVDAGDASPVTSESTVANGCGRTLTVQARDRCGNVGQATRSYRVAEQVGVTINGANEGQLVAQARMTWVVIGPADCAGPITATIARDGGGAQAYAANTLLNVPGNHVLTVTVPNCLNVARQITRNFIINAPPVVAAITANHPRRDPNGPAGRPSYIVDEGTPLQVDASDTRAPEAGDLVARYQWDWRNDGTFDFDGAASPLADYPTSDSGLFVGKLRATDSLGAFTDQIFQVTVRDVSPIADPAGPYTVAQGVQLQVDGSRSRAGSPADAITMYEWDWGDGSPVQRGMNLNRPTHTYAEHGPYNLRLRVLDEDNSVEALVLVTVTDVNPIIVSITPPDPLYEIASMTFTAVARPGAPADAITRYEWDFNGDGQPEVAGPNASSAVMTFDTAGPLTVGLRVLDKDSSTAQTINVTVREITFAELLVVARTRIAAVTNNAGAPLLARQFVANTSIDLDNGAWGERYNRRGNTWIAYDGASFDIQRSLVRGGDYGNLLWAMSRQFLRETARLRATVAGLPAQEVSARSVAQADTFIAQAQAIYARQGFRQAVSSPGQGDSIWSRDLFAAAYEAYFYLKDATDPCSGATNGQFAMPDVRAVEARVLASNEVNGRLETALITMRTDLEAYMNAGANDNRPAPGRAKVLALMPTLNAVINFTRQDIGILCEAGACISDYDALDNEIQLMNLIDLMYEAAGDGVYTRQWQSCLMLATKFRIELSVLRVEYMCGLYHPVALAARRAQAIGLGMVSRYEYDAALNYYIDDDRRCLMIRTYNECIVPRSNGDSDLYEFPEACVND